MTEPADYAEKVYAGIVGKIVGVHLGQPIEGWALVAPGDPDLAAELAGRAARVSHDGVAAHAAQAVAAMVMSWAHAPDNFPRLMAIGATAAPLASTARDG